MTAQRIGFVVLVALHGLTAELIRTNVMPAWTAYLTLVASITAGLLQVLPPAAKPSKAEALVSAGGAGPLVCLALALVISCKDAGTVANVDNGIATVEQMACIAAGGFTDAKTAALACGLAQDAGNISQAVLDFVSRLLQAQRLAADPAFKAKIAASQDGGLKWYVDAGGGK
jgi:hypothetical protein